MSERYWLLLEKSDDTRVSKGIDGYQDKTGESYHYDSLVPNHKQLAADDYVVLRKENDILGVGRISSISQDTDLKIHRRCPECESTDIRERTTKTPKWKCGNCSHEFESPNETIVEVQSFIATIIDFTRLNSPPDVRDVKSCAAKGDGVTSQLSILELDSKRIQNLLEGIAPTFSARSPRRNKGGQGFGLSQEERKSVELHAMRIARNVYEEEGWKVIDKSSSHPFDLLATKNGQQRFIEVKGTTGGGLSIMLTHGEVNHVLNHKKTSALVIVSNIVLDRSGSELVTTGGEVSTFQDPWAIYEDALEPTEYRYKVQQKSPDQVDGREQ